MRPRGARRGVAVAADIGRREDVAVDRSGEALRKLRA
jgi:hypothetical protein